ncbi:2TM domain-containing protein [Bacillus sp. sid0103]|uniref:2TM domain-containing protein n=1 Tax=Bacillus sp. sid0103 TaxID=2856337 RepID=UPI001C486B7C|nr:2TM domain-containing protein [Bacillus sp. sid0103]MBV7508690.1 2TM domain-containing protein [Bacillus sp. sid0103]
MKKFDAGFAAAGSVMSIIFFILVNYLTSPHYPWFIYPSIVLLLWPIGLYCLKNGKHKHLSLSYSALIIAFLTVENYLYSPYSHWSLYAIYPIFWWPILIYLKKHALTLTVALAGSTSIILYYAILNLLLSPGYPWVIFPTFAIVWWPLAIYHAKKKTFFEFSIHATLIIAVFFIILNVISTPHTVWAVYPIFCILWWPLSMYYFVYKRKLIK